MIIGPDWLRLLRHRCLSARREQQIKAAVIKGKVSLSIEEVPTPKPYDGEVLIEVKYCGICGSDVHLIPDGILSTGMIPGHEFCGTIAEIGPGVEGWKIGERVTAVLYTTCGECYYCLQEQKHHCTGIQIMAVDPGMPGAFADFVKVRAQMLRRVPDEISDEEAATVEPCAVSLRAVRHSGMKAGDSTVIFGAGAIGLFALQCARMEGAGPVYVVEPVESRAHVASTLGADRVLCPKDLNVVGEIRRLTTEGADIAYLCTDAPPVLQQAMDTVRKQGKVIVVAGGWSAEVVPQLLVWKEIMVKGSFMYLDDEFSHAMDLFRQKKVTTKGMISRIIPLEELPRMIQDLSNPVSDIKILVKP